MGAIIQSNLRKILQYISDKIKTVAEIKKSLSVRLPILLEKIKKNLNSFHALHSSLKMDRVDYTFKFSTELIVLALSIFVIGANFISAKNFSSMNNNTLLARMLSYHPSWNKLLYNKSTAVTTVVANNGGLIRAAEAEVVLTSLDSLQPADGSSSFIDNNAIVKEDPDNIKDLVANQIQNYTVQAGDTIAGIAAKYHLSQNTIIWANNITGSTLKPGQVLVILPSDGLIHKMGRNDTLPDLAKAYNANLDQIIAANGYADASDSQEGDLVFIPGGVIPQTAKPAPVKHLVKGKTVYEPRVNLTPTAGHVFPWGQCTYYVAFRWNALGKLVDFGGNANRWIANARAQGHETGSAPMPGAIVQFRGGRYGHVALVEQVTGDSIVVSEMNYEGLGKIDQRTIPIGSSSISGYIYN